MLEQVHLKELLRLQPALLGQGLDLALEARIALHHESTSKYIRNSSSTPSALHILASLGRSAFLRLKYPGDRVADELGVGALGWSLCAMRSATARSAQYAFTAAPAGDFAELHSQPVNFGGDPMDPCAGVFARETVRVVAVRHGDVDCGGNPVGEARQVQCARVREDALAPSAGYRGELVVEHVGGAVDAPRELVYGTVFRAYETEPGRNPASEICAALATPPSLSMNSAISSLLPMCTFL